MCHDLLEQPDVEAAIRVGDVYALMIEWFYSQRQMEQAHTGPSPTPYPLHPTPYTLHLRLTPALYP